MSRPDPNISLIICFLLTFFLSSCSKNEPEWVTSESVQKTRGSVEGPIPVEIANVDIRDIKSKMTLTANILPGKSVVLSAKMPGQITEINVEEGAVVLTNKILARMEDKEIQLETERANSAYQTAKAEYERIKRLYEQEAATISQMESVEMKYKDALGSLDVLKDKLSSARIVAPFAGIISRKHVSAGTVVNPGQPVIELINLDRVKIEFNISESDINLLKVGQKAEISLDAYPQEKFSGTIDYISASADTYTRMFPIRITINNPKQKIKSGMSAKVEIATGISLNAKVVPKAAIYKKSGEYYVFVVKESKAYLQKVTLGLQDNEFQEVKSGVEKGESVVIRGYENLIDGATVQIVSANK